MIVRFWLNGYQADSINVYINDWERGRFTLPWQHPLAKRLFEATPNRDVLITVEAEPEPEWLVSKAVLTREGYVFVCDPRNIRTCLRSDAYLVQMDMVDELVS